MASSDMTMPHSLTKTGLRPTNETYDNRSQSQPDTLNSDDVNGGPSPGSPEESESEDDEQVAQSEIVHRRRIQNAQFEAL